MYIAGAPSNLSGALAAHYQSGAERWKTLKAAGIIERFDRRIKQHDDIPLIAPGFEPRVEATMTLAAPGNNDSEGEKITIT